jgi:hypothetical protein
MADEFITPEQLEAKLAAMQTQLNGAIARITNEFQKTLTESLAPLAEGSKTAASVKAELDAIKKLMEEEDDNDTLPGNTETPDVQKMIEAALANANKGFEAKFKEQAARSAAIEKQLKEEQDNAARILKESRSKQLQQDAIASINGLRKEANVPLFDGVEDVLFQKLVNDGLVVETENGYMLREQIDDPYMPGSKVNKDVSLSEGLPAIVSSKYSQFIQPRGGVGTNATPPGGYRTPSQARITANTTTEDLLKAADDPNKWDEIMESAKQQLAL